MKNEITVGGIVKTSIVTAFTIAAALIWKDVITESINIFYPAGGLLYKFMAAIVATIFVVIAIYVILKTELEAELMIKGLSKMNKTKKKKILREIKKEAVKQEIKDEKRKIRNIK